MGGWIKVDMGKVDSDYIRAQGRPFADTFCDIGVGENDPNTVLTAIDADGNAMCEIDDPVLELRRCFHDGPSMVSIFTDERGELKQDAVVSGKALESAEVFVGSFVDEGDQVAVVGEDGNVSIYQWQEDVAHRDISSAFATIDFVDSKQFMPTDPVGQLMTALQPMPLSASKMDYLMHWFDSMTE